MPATPLLLLVGEVAEERLNITDLCAQFGWSVKPVKTLDDLSNADRSRVVAGFTDASFDGGRALAEATRRFPRVYWIGCCRFGSPGERQDIDRSIAYHVIHRPFDVTEVLQCLHFIQAALAGRACTSAVA
jgi:hypothetical protein